MTRHYFLVMVTCQRAIATLQRFWPLKFSPRLTSGLPMFNFHIQLLQYNHNS